MADRPRLRLPFLTGWRAASSWQRASVETHAHLLLGVAWLFLLLGFLAWTRQDFLAVEQYARTDLEMAAHLLEQQTLHSLTAIERVLDGAAAHVHAKGLDALRGEAGWQYLRELARVLPETGGVFVYDRQGRLLASSASHPPPAAGAADRAFFRHLLAGGAEPYIGEALAGRTVHRHFFPVARSLRDARGQVVGVVQVGVEVDHLGGLFRYAGLGWEMVFGVFRREDGKLVARHPMRHEFLGASVASYPCHAHLTTGGATWSGEVQHGVDGQKSRLVAGRAMSSYPLLVLASMSREDALRPAWQALLLRGLGFAAGSALLLILGGLWLRALKREQASRAELLAANAALNDSQARLAGFAAASFEGIVVSENGVIRDCNRQMELLLGHPPGGLLGIRVEDLIPAEGRERALVNLRQNRSGEVTHELLRLDDSRVTVEVRGYTDPASGRRFSVVRDISARVRAEAALRDSEARYRSLVEQAVDGIFLADTSGRYLDANSAGLAMLGYSLDELRDLSIRDVILTEEVPRLPGHLASLEPGDVVVSEWRFQRKDGSSFLGEVVGRHLTDGRLLGILRDVTERRQAEDALRESEERLRQARELLEAVTDGTEVLIATVDRDYRYTFFNRLHHREIFRLTGRKTDLGMSLREVLADMPEERDKALAIWGRALAGETVVQELQFGEAGGYRRWYSVRHAPILDAAGEVVGAGEVTSDITERREAEARHLTDMARQRDALVREVHHRIKNHLHGVLGLMHMQVSKTPELAPPMREVMAQINTIAGVYGLLGVAGGVAGGLTQIVALVASGTAGLVSVTYRAAPDEPLLLAEADAVPVALVVNELVNNAVKHLAPPVPERPVQVTLEARSGQVVLSVKNGPARLPEGFDFARGRGLGTGLELVTTLLPREGAHLSIVQDGDEVCAELRLEMPVVRVA